jgi:hypothetical protein
VTRRILAVVVLVGFAGAGLWWWRSPGQKVTPPSGVQAIESVGASAAAAPSVAADVAQTGALAARLELGIEAYSAGPDDEMVVVVRLFDADARQAEAIRTATGGRWKGGAGTLSTAPVALPAGWAEQVQLLRGADSQLVDIRGRLIGPGDAVRLVVAALPPGTMLTANLTAAEPNVRSSVIEVDQAPSTRLDAAVARARIAEVLERWDALAAIASELVGLNDRSPWGHYYQGVVAGARGDDAGERAAFQRALNRIEPGAEMPRGLRPE